jgi:transposase
LFLRRPEELTTQEKEMVQWLRQLHPEVDLAYLLVQQFVQMVRTRTGERLDAWLSAVASSPLANLQSFANGISEDKEAIFAGLTRDESNGPLEGNVNRLKLIKRSMYGRAEFGLLKIRVLYQSKRVQDRKNKQKNNQGQPMSRLKKTRMTTNSGNSQHTIFEISEVA